MYAKITFSKFLACIVFNVIYLRVTSSRELYLHVHPTPGFFHCTSILLSVSVYMYVRI